MCSAWWGGAWHKDSVFIVLWIPVSGSAPSGPAPGITHSICFAWSVVFLQWIVFSVTISRCCRLSLLQSLVQPDSLKLDWLLLAVSHDAPLPTNTVDLDGNPRWLILVLCYMYLVFWHMYWAGITPRSVPPLRISVWILKKNKNKNIRTDPATHP